MTITLPCRCENKFQDAKYGRGNRLHNSYGKWGTLKGWRCTVCKTEKDALREEKREEKR